MASTDTGKRDVPSLVKMKKADIPKVRKMLVEKQNGICPICGGDLTRVAPINVVIDHDHDTGIVRAALHRGCNALDGKVKRLIRTWGKAPDMHEVMCTLGRLLKFWQVHSTYQTNIIYYNHKTAAEKRLAYNKKRRLTAKKKREV